MFFRFNSRLLLDNCISLMFSITQNNIFSDVDNLFCQGTIIVKFLFSQLLVEQSNCEYLESES